MNTKRIGFRQRTRLTYQGEKPEQVQRWLCKECGQSFSAERRDDTKFQTSVAVKAAELYFDSEASYRAVGRRLHLRPLKVFQLVNALGQNCKNFVEVAQEMKPNWSGYLLFDGKTVHVRKQEQVVLLAADAGTQDVICAEWANSEDYSACKRLALAVRDEIRYPVKGITIDGSPGLIKAVIEVFPDIKYQLCVKHLDSYHQYFFKYKYHGSSVGVPEFLNISHRLLYATKPSHLNHVYRDYLNFLDRLEGAIDFQNIIAGFESKFGNLWVHFEHSGLPRTTNIIEGIIRQLSRKIDDTDGFSYVQTGWNSIKLLIMRYRFKKFTCSRIKGHNGHSPLTLAGVRTAGLNWVAFSQKQTH